MCLAIRLFAVTVLSIAAVFTVQRASAEYRTSTQYRASVGCSAEKIDRLNAAATLKELECTCFNRCDVSTPPPPHLPTHETACDERQLVAWLDEHGAYGGRLDPSIYDDQVDWIVSGKPAVKTRSEIAKEEDDFRKVYPVQIYTARTSSTAVVRGQCVLTQQLDVHKRRSNGKEEYGTFRIVFGIRTDADPPRIVAQHIDVLSGR